MASITTTRATRAKVFEGARRHLQIVVAAGQTLYHGTIGGLNATNQAAAPGSGVRPLGRVSCPNAFSAVAGETVDIEEGSFAWDLLAGATLPAIDAPVYAASNHEVSDDFADGPFLGVYEGRIDGLDFYKSGHGVADHNPAT